MKKYLSLLLIFILSITILSGCGSNEKTLVGEWYNEKGKCLDIRSDGTWKLEDSYGTGTWKFLDDNETVEFTDFYGDTQESKINEDELGKYIDFGYYGDFYKDSYPSEEEISEVKAQNAVLINPFEGIKYELSGISPYCKISINNQGCSNEVQKYVTYKFDKENYANGETAVVTAELSTNTGENSYKLTSDSANYQIANRPEYITTGDSVDFSTIEKEATDFITSSIAKAVGSDELCDLHIYYDDVVDHKKATENDNTIFSYSITSVNPTLSTVYFSTIKKNKEDAVINSSSVPYNTYSFIYKLSVTGEVNKKVCYGDVYVNVYANNVIRNSDGTVTWDNEKCSVDLIATTNGLENCISNTITSKSDNYNITKVEQ